jgi:hypothetical protein
MVLCKLTESMIVEGLDSCLLKNYNQLSSYGCVAKFFVIRDNAHLLEIEKPMISFKGAHFPKDVILYAVFFYVRYGVLTAI